MEQRPDGGTWKSAQSALSLEHTVCVVCSSDEYTCSIFFTPSSKRYIVLWVIFGSDFRRRLYDVSSSISFLFL
jgi:hypothetical protein